MTYTHTPDMGEISGFGGGYEAACLAMLDAGVRWLDANPNADPQFRGFKNVYGVILEDNADAKALSDAVLAGSGGDCTGAMHQAVVTRVLHIKSVGWEKYCIECREYEAKEPTQ